jgi:Fe-S-cluster containining protein
MRQAWERLADRYRAYSLCLPGSASFICQAQLCKAHCCRAFSVNLGEGEVARMEAASGLAAVRFLECEEGEPIVLPMAQPYLLARADNRCRLLGDDLACTQYHGRPNACRLYPHFMIFFDAETERPVTAEQQGMRASFSRPGEPYTPLLLRHVECPGFTGPPMTDDAWERLAGEIYHLQYDAV